MPIKNRLYDWTHISLVLFQYNNRRRSRINSHQACGIGSIEPTTIIFITKPDLQYDSGYISFDYRISPHDNRSRVAGIQLCATREWGIAPLRLQRRTLAMTGNECGHISVQSDPKRAGFSRVRCQQILAAKNATGGLVRRYRI